MVHVIDLANMRMIQSGNRASFLLKAMSILPFKPFDGDSAIQPHVSGFPHFSHAALADQSKNLVGT